jgi:hypothetical protein
LPMTTGTIGIGTGAPILGTPQPAPPPTGQTVSAPLAPIPGTTPPPTAIGPSRGAGIATPWIPPSGGTGAAMPTFAHPPIRTVKAEIQRTQAQAAESLGSRTPESLSRGTETHKINIQGTQMQGIKIQGIKIQGIKINGTLIQGASTSANAWQLAVIARAVTGIGIPRSHALKSGAVPPGPRIPGTMAPECHDVASLC